MQAEGEGNPSDGGVIGSPADRVQAGGRLGGIEGFQYDPPVVIGTDAGIHSGAAALQSVRVYPRVFERLPARFQHQALLRVQHLRLDRRNAEKRGVEPVNVVYETGETTRLSLVRGVPEQRADTPDAGTRNALADRILAGFQQTPERRNIRRAGEAAGHADDGYRLSEL